MSPPANTQPTTPPGHGTWMCDDYQEAVDSRENDKGVVEIRMHATAQRHCIVKAEDVPDNLDVGISQQSIDFYIGDQKKTYDVSVIGGSASMATDRWLCVGDGFKPLQNPSNLAVRTQNWEYFSKYIPCPDSWQGGPP